MPGEREKQVAFLISWDKHEQFNEANFFGHPFIFPVRLLYVPRLTNGLANFVLVHVYVQTPQIKGPESISCTTRAPS